MRSFLRDLLFFNRMTFSLPILLFFIPHVFPAFSTTLYATTTSNSSATAPRAMYKKKSFSGLARALNTVSQSLSIAQALLPAAAAQTSAAASTVSHYVKNQRIRRFNVELVHDDSSEPSSPVDNIIPLGPRRPSHVFTNLALGNRMESLMATGNNAVLPTTPSGSFRFSLDPTTSLSGGQQSSVQGPSSLSSAARPPLPDHPTPGIPIPQVRREYTTGYVAGSPPTGRYSHQLNVFGSGGSAGTSPSHMTPGSVGGGAHYLDVYGGSVGSGSGIMGSISRATTPQRQVQMANSSVSSVSGDFRLGRPPSDAGYVFYVAFADI